MAFGVGVAGISGAAFAILAVLLAVALVLQIRRANRFAQERDASRASERRFRTLTEFSADLIIESDLDMVRHYVSPRSHDLLGYAPEQLLGKPGLSFVHPDDVSAYRSAIDGLLDGSRERVVTTQRYRRRDGRYVWTEANVQLIRNEIGEPAGYIGSLRDVEARHAAATALRTSEAFLRSVIDSSPDCVKVLDLDGRITFISRNGLRMTPATMRDGIIGSDFLAMWPQPARWEATGALAAAASGARARFAARLPSETGPTQYLDVLVSPILDKLGRPERLLVLTRDTSAAVEADAALRESQSRYQLLAENSSDVVLLRTPGPDGATLFASPSCRLVLGYAPEAVVATADPAEMIHPEDRDRVRALLATLEPAAGPVRDTHRVLKADGTFIWVEGAFHLAERAGAAVVVAALRDVSERQRRAEDLAAAKDMAERAQKVAEDASLAKSDFLAVMSHEIRTPMNSIIGFTDLMLDSGDLPLENRRQAELIRAAGSALLTMVNDILDFSKIEAGAVELEAITFDPAALARQSAAILGGYAGTKALEIQVETAADLPEALVGDEARLRQILLNLLNNAVKFTLRGRVVLRVAISGRTDAGETLRFEVEDTGIGIPASQQHRLFERFSQVDTSVARRFGGSGLGLAICKKLVGLMGGEIGVESRDGEGSTFWFTATLPRAGRPLIEAPLDSAIRRPARILVAEDLDINRRLAVALLEAAGHTAQVVSDGAEAVAAVAAGTFDLVLMDVRMPGMDGVTATRLIRQSDGPQACLPIIAMTANVYPEQIDACRRAGMDGHVGKPLNRAQLYAAIDRVLLDPARATRHGRADRIGALDVPPRDLDDAPVFDGATYAQLRDFLGVARLDDMLTRFAESLPQHFEPGIETEGRARRWKADAHVVVSVAGMLGFADLARRCRAFEAASHGSDDHAARLAAVRAARDVVLLRLADLRRDLGTSGERGSTAA